MRSSGHKILITGGAKGIGLALARKFHSNDNEVTIAGRDPAALDAAATELTGIRTICADIATPGGIDTLVAGAAETSVLINNAGVQINGEFSQFDFPDIETELGTNLSAPLQLTHRVLPGMLASDEAAVINVTSILGIVPKQSAPVYCASKAALRSFSRALRWQLEGTAVRVIEVIPPVVDTGMTRGRDGDKISPGEVAEQTWQGYLADQAEIYIGKARLAAFLARWVPSLAENILRRS